MASQCWSVDVVVCFPRVVAAAVITWYGDEQVEALQDVHLLEPAGVDEGVHLALTTTVQQLQTVLRAHQQVHTWGRTHPHINSVFISE